MAPETESRAEREEDVPQQKQKTARQFLGVARAL
jgi:hypothetical protein